MSKEFTAKQKEIVARKLGYDGPMQGFDEFLQSSPALAMKYGMIADKYMAKGGDVVKFSNGGLADDEIISSTRSILQSGGSANFALAQMAQRGATQDQLNRAAQALEQSGYSGLQIPTVSTGSGASSASTKATREQVLAAYQNNPLAVLNPDEEAIDYWMRTGLNTFDQVVKDVRAANPTLAKQIDQERAALAIASDPQAAALAAAREGIAKGMTNQQIADMVNSKYGKSFSEQNIADFIINNNITDTRQKPKITTTTDTTTTAADTTASTGGGTPGQQYTDVGRPIAGAVSQVTAAQTEFTPEMKLDAQKYVAGAAPTAAVTTAQAAPAVVAPAAVKPTQVTAAQTQQMVQQALAPLTAAQGQAPTIEAAQLTPEQMQAAMAQAQQLDQAQKVQQAQRTLQADELVSGPTVDQQRVEQAIAQTQAAQGKVTEEMTVQGQLAKLTADFDTRNPPPWAAGAVRAATSMLAARGLGASSMAGQAIIQATFESAIPIASADAAAYQQMEAQNLSNRQQVAVLAAQQRAQFLGQEFDQSFQTRVLNAAKIADIANMNFTAQQQVYLENARLAQSVDLANLSNRQATVMANAATIANMETANLSARQQAAVANAQNFLQMSIANMNNQQQVALFKAQELTQSILSDAAAENAARQFNATSQLQADQFNAQITTQVSQFNAAQKNAMEQFNAGQTNAMSQFNAQIKAQREEFNVKNRTIIDQANAQLLAQISLSNTAALNAGNFENARAMNNMTMSQYNNEVQLYRDQIKMVFDSYERAEDRAASMATAVLQANLAREKMDADTSASFAKLVGSLVTGTKLGDKIIDAGTDFLKNLFGP